LKKNTGAGISDICDKHTPSTMFDKNANFVVAPKGSPCAISSLSVAICQR